MKVEENSIQDNLIAIMAQLKRNFDKGDIW